MSKYAVLKFYGWWYEQIPDTKTRKWWAKRSWKKKRAPWTPVSQFEYNRLLRKLREGIDMRKKKLPAKRDPNAKALEDPLFRQRVVPTKKQKEPVKPRVDEDWE